MNMNRFVKRAILSLAIMISGMPVVSAQKYFSELTGRKDIETVYVSKALLASAPSLGSLGRFGVQLGKATSLSVFTTEQPSGLKACRESLADFVSANSDAELLFQQNDDEDITSVYGIPVPGSDGKYSLLLVYNADQTDATLVVITGEVTFDPS